MSINRRDLLRGVFAAGAMGAASPFLGTNRAEGGMFGYQRFTQPFFKPPVIGKSDSISPAPGSDEAKVGSDGVYHGIAPEYYPDHPAHLSDWDRFDEKYWEMESVEGTWQFFPGIDTPVFAYRGKPGTNSETMASFPGPTFLARQGEPNVLRFANHTSVENSIHLHGDHGPAHSDGHPDFYV
ncbi:MAG: multicopper oxidase domain-containing protein, partial [Planctomycetota bacterium]